MGVFRRQATDDLTGLPLRRAGREALARVNRGDAIAMIDLDELKKVNDTFGHEAGDEHLVVVAAKLVSLLRRDDVVVRWGGDEFVLVLRGAADAASGVLERLRRESRVPFSAGVAVHTEGDPASTLAAADEALLAAKRAGGGRVVTA